MIRRPPRSTPLYSSAASDVYKRSRSGRDIPTAAALPRYGSGEVEAVEIHDLVPRGDEVTHELLLRVVARVDLRKCTELGVRPEDEVNAAAGPLELARGEV